MIYCTLRRTICVFAIEGGGGGGGYNVLDSIFTIYDLILAYTRPLCACVRVCVSPQDVVQVRIL